MKKDDLTKSAVRSFIAVPAFILCLLTSGCVWFAPLPQKHLPISSRKSEDYEFVKWGHPERSAVEAKLGTPDLFCPDLHVDVYRVEKIERPKVKLLFCLIPVGWFNDYPGIQTAYIQFDERDRVQRFGFVVQYGEYLRHDAENWVASSDGKQPTTPRPK